jgi:hypothetical protein
MSTSGLAQPSTREPIPKATASHKSDGLRSISGVSQPSSREPSSSATDPLQHRIDWWVSHWNDHPEPFIWTRTADEIIDKVARGRATLDRITTSATHH